MGYGEMLKLLTKMQDSSESQFDLVINSRNKTIQIKFK